MLTILLIFILLAILAKKGEKFCKDLEVQKELREREERLYKERTLGALECISYALTPEVEPVPEKDLLEGFLESNKRYEEKKSFDKVLKEELGIN